jgi:hypothetical protein
MWRASNVEVAYTVFGWVTINSTRKLQFGQPKKLALYSSLITNIITADIILVSGYASDNAALYKLL